MALSPGLVVIGAVVALLGGGFWIARAVERRRREALEQYCLVRGFRFERERPGQEQAYADILPLFDTGHSRRWGYTVTGRSARPFTAFEYRWTTGGGKSSQTHWIGGLLWETEEREFPVFRVEPEGVFSRIGQFFGMQDFDFPEDPEFSRAYALKGGDEKQVRELFTPRLRGFLAATPGQRVAGAGRVLVWWRNGRLPKPDKLDEFLAEAELGRRAFAG